MSSNTILFPGRRSAAIGVLVAAPVAAVLIGCGNSRDDVPHRESPTHPAASSAAQTTSASPLQPDDRTAAEAAYREFWTVVDGLDRGYPDAKWRSVVGRFAVDPALSRVIAGAQVRRRHGIAVYGHSVPHPVRVSVTAGRKAVVVDCLDASRTGQASAKTGKPMTVGVARSPVNAVVVRGEDGRWRVSEARFVGGDC